MISRLLFSFVILSLLTVAGGFIVLAVWDVPVKQELVEKPVNTSEFLGKPS